MKVEFKTNDNNRLYFLSLTDENENIHYEVAGNMEDNMIAVSATSIFDQDKVVYTEVTWPIHLCYINNFINDEDSINIFIRSTDNKDILQTIGVMLGSIMDSPDIMKKTNLAEIIECEFNNIAEFIRFIYFYIQYKNRLIATLNMKGTFINYLADCINEE